MKKLSVIVPIYNVSSYLPRCIDSLINQTIPFDEIILVDDGSTDDSGDIADNYSKQYSNIKVIHQANGGLSSARNTGIDHSTGRYIAFVDSDDYIEQSMNEELLSILSKTHANIVKGGVWYEQENGEKYSPYPEKIEKVWNTEEALIELNSYKYFNMSAWGGIYERILFEGSVESGQKKLRFPIGKLCEDYYLMHQIISRADLFAYTSKPLYHYIQRANSISRNKKVNMESMNASLAQLDFFNKYYPHLAYVAETAVAFSHMGIYSAHIRQGLDCPKDVLKHIRIISRRYCKSVIRNSHIPGVKKLQALSFCYALPLYKLIIKRTAHR